MSSDLSRRGWLAGVVGTAAIATQAPGGQPVQAQPKTTFGFCLNTSTVRDKDGKSRPIVELIDIAAKAGYDAIEPWVSEIDAYVKEGGSLKDLRKRIEQAGLKVADVIGFAEWIVEDPERRKKGLEQAKRDMDWAAQIGSPRIAAPPVGATGGTSKRDDPKFTQPVIDLLAAADRYRALL
ncbi:MAG TPA: TIM barrel protein, partial [Gemmata sp.]|nr:TIM barrel protein [Gemmata sp.]